MIHGARRRPSKLGIRGMLGTSSSNVTKPVNFDAGIEFVKLKEMRGHLGGTLLLLFIYYYYYYYFKMQ